MSSNITRPTFSSGEKRKARALRQSLSEVQSFGFSSCASPFFSFDITSTISGSVVKRFLQNNDERITEKPPKSSNAEGTPLFASKHSNLIDAGRECAYEANMNVGLFGYSCSNDDSSVASTLRRINGGRGGGNMIDAFSQALPMSSLATFEGGAINDRLCNVKKRLKYNDGSCVDLTAVQDPYSDTDSPKILSSSSNDGDCGSTVYSNSEMDDGTVHEDWIIEDDEEKGKGESASLVKERTSGVEVLDASFIIWAGSSARANLGQTK